MKTLITSSIKFYQKLPLLAHSACRFTPTCSQYALEAIEKHGSIKGGWLALKRVLRCQPLTRGGYDPLN